MYKLFQFFLTSFIKSKNPPFFLGFSLFSFLMLMYLSSADSELDSESPSESLSEDDDDVDDSDEDELSGDVLDLVMGLTGSLTTGCA